MFITGCELTQVALTELIVVTFQFHYPGWLALAKLQDARHLDFHA